MGLKPSFRKTSSKLTRKAVEEIRELYFHTNMTQGELGRRFGVTSVHIGRIIRGESWADEPSLEEMRIAQAEQLADSGQMPAEVAADAAESQVRFAAMLTPAPKPEPPRPTQEEHAETMRKIAEQLRIKKEKETEI